MGVRRERLRLYRTLLGRCYLPLVRACLTGDRDLFDRTVNDIEALHIHLGRLGDR